MSEIGILGYARTPIGSFRGNLSPFNAPQLAGIAVTGALEKSKIDKTEITDLIFGNVLSAGNGMAAARQVCKFANLQVDTTASTMNKVCGSGLAAINLARLKLISGDCSGKIVAVGSESMTNAPYIDKKSRIGTKYGKFELLDHIVVDGISDPFTGESMGVQAEEVIRKYKVTKTELDEQATESLKLAQNAANRGFVEPEITMVTIESKDGIQKISKDELPLKFSIEKISNMKPAFKSDGLLTAASSSSLADGAAAVVLGKVTNKNSSNVLAYIEGYVEVGIEAKYFTFAPVLAIKKLLNKIDWSIDSVDLFEVNEAFASVPIFVQKELGISPQKINVFGGACALGHPLGCSGVRIVVTLLNALQTKKLKRGVAAICIGGGEASALAIEVC